jgi:sterol desaturase/sphingolipid hydroxylase (fatty acid hydroxylase superfamily)
MENAQQWSDLTFGGIVLQYVALLARDFGALYFVGIVFYFIERIKPAVPSQNFFKRDFLTELGYPAINAALGTPLFTLLMAFVGVYLLEPFVPHQVMAAWAEGLPFVAQVLLALLIADIAVYVEHRFIAHRYLWDYHAMHHMTPEVSWLTVARVHPVNAMTIALIAAVLRFVFGFSGEAVVLSVWITGALVYWEHANVDFGLPKPLCYLLVSPRFHRWHHAKEAEAVDKNFCLIFPFLDLLGGTYYCPERMPRAYGLYVAPDAPDEVKRAADIPDDFRGQMIFPFRRSWEKMRLARGQRPAVVGALQQVDRSDAATPSG